MPFVISHPHGERLAAGTKTTDVDLLVFALRGDVHVVEAGGRRTVGDYIVEHVWR